MARLGLVAGSGRLPIIFSDIARAKVRNITVLNGVFLFLSEGHKKHIAKRTAIVKIYGLPKERRNSQPGVNIASSISVISHDSGYRKNNSGVKAKSRKRDIIEKMTKE